MSKINCVGLRTEATKKLACAAAELMWNILNHRYGCNLLRRKIFNFQHTFRRMSRIPTSVANKAQRTPFQIELTRDIDDIIYTRNVT